MTVKRTSSGQHAAVQAFRKKMESIQDGTLEELLDLNRQLDAEIEARKDPRRDGDGEIPVELGADEERGAAREAHVGDHCPERRARRHRHSHPGGPLMHPVWRDAIFASVFALITFAALAHCN